MSGNGKQADEETETKAGQADDPALVIEAEAPPLPPSGVKGETSGEFKAAAREFSHEAPTLPNDPVAALDAAVEQLQREKKELYDRLLRTAADFDNYKKRARKDVQEGEERERTRLLKEILPVIDNLERALAHQGAQPESASSVVEGVKLVLRQFQSALEKLDVHGFASVHQPFDPQVHEAISQLETKDHPAGTVVAEYQRGYMMGKRLLRPATVVVAKMPSEDSPASSPEGDGQADPDAGGI